MKKIKPLLALLILSASLVSCGTGLKVTACVVDAAHESFRCTHGSSKTTVPLVQGEALLCASPIDTENFLKACKEKQILDITLCQYEGAEFTCKLDGVVTEISVADADNYFCLSALDFSRLKQRCK